MSFASVASARLQTFIVSFRTVFTLKLTVLETRADPAKPILDSVSGNEPFLAEATKTLGCVFGTAAQPSPREHKGVREKLVPSW